MLFRSGATHTYQHLLDRSAAIAFALLDGADDLREARIAVLVTPGPDYTSAQWAVWRAGGIMLPLSASAAEREWEHALTDAQVSVVIADAAHAAKLAPLCDRRGVRLMNVQDIGAPARTSFPAVDVTRGAMILYTSGTTSTPKGVLTTHANIQAQIECLVQAWEWQSSDRIPLFLPLHHIHGIINVVSCALYSGAQIEPFEGFEQAQILQRLQEDAFTLFMAVPTIYVRLIRCIEELPDEAASAVCSAFSRLRLMVSGSAALPAAVHERWQALTGQTLLERYGMTEIGMALSNPLRGERRAGSVGYALPGVAACLADEQGLDITADEVAGEIRIRGPGVFQEYWQRPDATAAVFHDGWFCTGDVAVIERGYFRILGRQSVDIIKSGGYKLSALEIEAVLLEHPEIRECAVVGLPDETWGEAVAVAAVLHSRSGLDLPALKDWCRERLSYYKLPKHLLICDALPRNAMGKVVKPDVRQLFNSSAAQVHS